MRDKDPLELFGERRAVFAKLQHRAAAAGEGQVRAPRPSASK
jgi:hypothetical protein